MLRDVNVRNTFRPDHQPEESTTFQYKGGRFVACRERMFVSMKIRSFCLGVTRPGYGKGLSTMVPDTGAQSSVTCGNAGFSESMRNYYTTRILFNLRLSLDRPFAGASC